MPRRSISAVAGGYGAAFLALASAAVAAYRLLGGTALLDTVGGAIERLARKRSTDALAVASVLVIAKAAAAALALALTHGPLRRLGTLAAIGGTLLALYGAVLTLAGALVLMGAISADPTDERALRWHTLFWDPWFLLWGLALATAGIAGRRSASQAGASRRSARARTGGRRPPPPPPRSAPARPPPAFFFLGVGGGGLKAAHGAHGGRGRRTRRR